MPEIYQPSDDSNLLSSVLKEEIKKLPNKNIKILEIGSGFGIQIETLISLGIKKVNIIATDVNADAIKLCKALGVRCIKSNLFENIKGKSDLIIFNPPYLPKNKSEPKSSSLATTGGKSGGEIINRFLRDAGSYLNKNGKVFLVTSSLTKGINWQDFSKKKLASKNLFFEELWVWELTIK